MSQKGKESEMTVEEKFQKMDPHEHVLALPDTYIGGIQEDTHDMWVYDEGTNKIIKKAIKYVPGLYKICDEIFVNACDQTIRDKTCKTIRIDIDKEKGLISCYNDGENGVPVVIHKTEKIYVPEMIVGHLRTSGNYKQTGKTVGGKNGYGVKLANIFSSKFKIEVVDKKNNSKYNQTFTENMYKKSRPKITELDEDTDKSYIKISLVPDFERFGIAGLTDDFIALLKKRVFDIAAFTDSTVKVFLNGLLLNVSNFKNYIEMFYNEMPPYSYSTVNDRWTICAVYDPESGYRQISHVNGICTFKGGSHERHVIDQIVGNLSDQIKKKHKDLKFKNSQIKDNITLFIKSTIEDPSFSSQIKEELTSKLSTFGSRCDIPDDFYKGMAKTGIIDEVVSFAKAKLISTMEKSDGKKTASLHGMPKLRDANWAGSRKSKECRLILTEGDSAATFAIAGREVAGHDKYGVFPLKGKPLNVRNATNKQLVDNEEIKKIKQIMGLKQGAEYDDDLTGLRYGGIIILTDQDVDGSHIKGLLINFIHHFWPSLLKVRGFIQTLATPIIKVWKTNDTKKKNPKVFYTLTDFEKWMERNEGNTRGWTKPKYYKGLGTSTDAEAKESFEDLDGKIINYVSSDFDETTKAINLVFDKKNTEDRKRWLENYDRGSILDNDNKNVEIHEFVNRDLIHFSNYDVERSIPSICDGFKPSLRKVMFGCFLRKIFKEEIKVAQLVGFISDKAAYHHGEASLEGAIVGMAQNFVGSNNINLLMPNGNFGNRTQGGNNASSSRYIFTQITEITPLIFRKEDEYIYEYNDDDGKPIEPVSYCPIIPMLLVNGCIGIGTGYSTRIPSFNPKDIINNIERMIKGKKPKIMVPWYRGFTGDVIEKESKNGVSYETSGKYVILNQNTIQITELPICFGTSGFWTDNYKLFLEGLLIDKSIKKGGGGGGSGGKKITNILTDIEDFCGNNTIDYRITFDKGVLQELIKEGRIMEVLKLTSSVSMNNLVAYNSNGVVHRYGNVMEILEEYFGYRMKLYEKRKEYILRLLKNELDLISWKVKFIEMVISGDIVVFEKNKTVKKSVIIERLEELEFPKLSSNSGIDKEDGKSYGYITNLSLFSLTEEELEKLRRENEIKLAEYKEYEEASIADLWMKELKELEKAYDKWLMNWEKEFEDGGKKGRAGGKKGGAKSGKK